MELILEQMRLCLLKEDFVSTQIIAKKISIKFFDDPAQHDLKLKYYNLMIRLDRDTSYLKTSRHYQAISEPPLEVPEEAKNDQSTVSDEKGKKTKSSTESVTAASGSAAASSKKKTKDSDKSGAKTVGFTLPPPPPKPVELSPEEAAELKQRLVCAVLYCVLAPYDNEQSDMMAHLSKNKKIEDIPVYK